ncbi:MAG: hypothetical protein AAGK14_04405 [Verrucomicrobiota bacterium]
MGNWKPKLAGLILITVWLPLAWIGLGPFRVRSVDSWTYGASIGYARWPLDLHFPLLGAWNNADTTWAIHWPGAFILWSFATPLLPPAAWAYTLLLTASWLLLALATAWLARGFADNHAANWWALAALALVLFDRALFESLLDLRGECLAALVLTALLLGYRQVLAKDDKQTLGAVLLVAGSFLLPLMHPVALPLAALINLALIGAWMRHPARRGLLAGALAASVAGSLALAGWFQFHPNGWGQLFEHASMNTRSYSFGGTFLSTLNFYAPTYLPALLAAAALAETARRFIHHWGVRTLWPALTGDDTALLSGLLLAVSLLAQQAFHNFFYYLITLPLVVALSLSLAAHLLAKLTARRQRLAALVLVAVLALHGLFLPARGGLWWSAGRPDFGAMAGDFLDKLPLESGARVVLPPQLWMEAHGRFPEERLRVVAPDYGSTWENRLAYVTDLAGRLRAGDLLILEHPWPQKPILGTWRRLVADPTRAELVAEFFYLTPGTDQHGMGLRAYRVLSPQPPADPSADEGGGTGGATSPARW